MRPRSGDTPSDAGAVFSDDGVIDPELEADLGAEYEAFEATKVSHAQLVEELAEAKRLSAEHLDLAQRRQADLDNFRKRSRSELADAVAREGQRLVAEMLPALDNLERAIEHATACGEAPELVKGVQMVHGQVVDVFAKEGVEIQDPLGKQFDPELHQAVQQREDATVPDGTVVEVFQKGYVQNGRVVRAAQVVVSTGGPHTENG